MDFSVILTILSTQSFDNERNKSLRSLIASALITSRDVPKLASLYTFDSDRTAALKIITPVLKNISSEDFVSTAVLYTHDSDKNKAVKILLDCLKEITSSDLRKLMESYDHDSNRTVGLSMVISLTGTITSTDFIAIVNTYKFDSEKANAIKYLSSKIKPDDLPPVESNRQNVEHNKLNVLTFLRSFGSMGEDLSLSMLEKNAMHLDLIGVDSICKEIAKFFKSIDNFRTACKILGITPEKVDLVEIELAEEIKAKLERNAHISIAGTLYRKDTFEIGTTKRFSCQGLTVDITRTNENFMIRASRGFSCSSCSANLDDNIIIEKSSSGVGTRASMGEVRILI